MSLSIFDYIQFALSSNGIALILDIVISELVSDFCVWTK